ncbi:histone-lysine N-methyltransferase SETMAR [Trichonephila clavipes]|nr:histone-lysine N-methyltransferase SETMAR [Trichonephila clavipes]
MGHEEELTIEELQEILNEEHQETQRNVSPSEQEEDERGPMSTSGIKDLLKKGEGLWRRTTEVVGPDFILMDDNVRPHIISGKKGKNAIQARKKLTDAYREAINSEVYCHQLDKLNDALQQKRSELINRKGVVFHQDNARPHTSLVTRQKLLQLEWDTMPHPPYSPDLAPSDYYLFRSLQNVLDGKTSTSNKEVKNHLDQFFASKEQKFNERGIMLLPESWQKVLDQNGQYIM